MTKQNIVIIHTKMDKTKSRAYLLKRNAEFQPFVVCSNYKELENGEVTWDWGHYVDTLPEALRVMYEDELDELDELATDEDGIVQLVNKLNEFIV